MLPADTKEINDISSVVHNSKWLVGKVLLRPLQSVSVLPVSGFVSSFTDYSGMSRVTLLLLQKSPCFGSLPLSRDVEYSGVYRDPMFRMMLGKVHPSLLHPLPTTTFSVFLLLYT